MRFVIINFSKKNYHCVSAKPILWNIIQLLGWIWRKSIILKVYDILWIKTMLFFRKKFVSQNIGRRKNAHIEWRFLKNFLECKYNLFQLNVNLSEWWMKYSTYIKKGSVFSYGAHFGDFSLSYNSSIQTSTFIYNTFLKTLQVLQILITFIIHCWEISFGLEISIKIFYSYIFSSMVKNELHRIIHRFHVWSSFFIEYRNT